MITATPHIAPPELTIVEAVELASAWLQFEAASVGARVLLLKGPTLHRQGLRDPHVSSDVDLWVEPGRFDDVVDRLKAAGRTEFAETFASEQFVTHSRTYRRPGWPNSLDVHSSWPGFLAAPERVFDAVWERRASAEIAHRWCDVPDRNANLLMLALHSLRGAASHPRHRQELEGLRRVELSASDRRDLAGLAEATGAAAPLQAFLRDIGIEVSVDPAVRHTPLYKEWHRKVAHAQGRTASWLIELRRAPWRRKSLVLRHGIWPTDHDLLAEHPDVPDRFWAKVWARMVRLGGSGTGLTERKGYEPDHRDDRSCDGRDHRSATDRRAAACAGEGAGRQPRGAGRPAGRADEDRARDRARGGDDRASRL